jgi:hypothetical protein
MKRITLFVMIAALAVTLAWLAGCNGSSTDSKPKAVGDTSSVEYQTVAEAFDDAESVDGMVLNGTFELIGSFFAPAAPRGNHRATAADPVFHEASMYWYCVNTASETTFVSGHPDSVENISNWTRVDSLQFLHSTTPVMVPNADLLTEIRAGVQLDGHATLTDDSVYATRHLEIVGAPGSLASHGDVTINAGGTTSGLIAITTYHNDIATHCQFGTTMTSVWRDLSINLADFENGSCPTAGSITWSGMLSLECARGEDSLSINGGWAYNQTFDGDQVTRVFENTTTRWSTTETCGSDVQTSPFSKDANPLK